MKPDAASPESLEMALGKGPHPFQNAGEIERAMRKLLVGGLCNVPFPGEGATLGRWKALAAVGAWDLSLAKIYESHADATAIVHELQASVPSGLLGVWAAEIPGQRLIFHRGPDGSTISGVKSWCSGAEVVDHAIVTAWTESGEAILAMVALRQRGISIDTAGWRAVGMHACESGVVTFDQAAACALGKPGDYTGRPGFWQGGAGVAAVWFGAAVALAQTLARSSRVAHDPHAAAHLGAIDGALRGVRALLIETAAWIDAHPMADAAAAALRVRGAVDSVAQEVLVRANRALGPGPLCSDPVHAQRCADLPVFLRQCHAEGDWAIVARLQGADSFAWTL